MSEGWTKNPQTGEYYYSTSDLRPKAFHITIFDSPTGLKGEIDGDNGKRIIDIADVHESIEYMGIVEFFAQYGEPPKETFLFQQTEGDKIEIPLPEVLG